jgi:hypothetical protein
MLLTEHFARSHPCGAELFEAPTSTLATLSKRLISLSNFNHLIKHVNRRARQLTLVHDQSGLPLSDQKSDSDASWPGNLRLPRPSDPSSAIT